MLKYGSPAPFRLESGIELPDFEIAYHTYGTLNENRDNVVWVCHALTANSDVADWWPHTVVEDGFLDPNRWFVVCANIIGSHYGTTGPFRLTAPPTSLIIMTFRHSQSAIWPRRTLSLPMRSAYAVSTL